MLKSTSRSSSQILEVSMFYAYRTKLPSQQRLKRPSHLCIFAAGKLSKEIALWLILITISDVLWLVGTCQVKSGCHWMDSAPFTTPCCPNPFYSPVISMRLCSSSSLGNKRNERKRILHTYAECKMATHGCPPTPSALQVYICMYIYI